ncbi:MAG: hypothetical protein JSR82_08770 [Verrucomicrobia bacterium]|nr:hypothetical protein [Verrucomicrobiota bacterium]
MKPQEEKPLEKDDALWEVLGRARPPGPIDPWFVQKVMRDLPPQDAPAAGWLSWLTSSAPRLWAPVAAALAVALIGLHAFSTPRLDPGLDEQVAIVLPTPGVEDPQVDAVLEDLDALVAFEDTSLNLEEPM